MSGTDELPATAIKQMLDLSTAHITAEDNRRCSERDIDDSYSFGSLPRIVGHAYGYIVFVTEGPDAIDNLRAEGFSEAFVGIYSRAAASENTIMLINFDSDADTVEGLATFDW